MLILTKSKDKDYYDYLMNLGIDRKIIYDRTIKGEIPQQKTYYFSDSINCIGFCGKIYPFISYKSFYYELSYSDLSSDEFIKFAKKEYSEEFYKLLKELYDTKEIIYDKDRIVDILSIRQNRSLWYLRNINKNEATEKYKEAVNNKKLIEIFKTHNIPVFVYQKNKVIFNPILKDYQFQKVKSPIVAYQELASFLSKEIEVDVPVGSDLVIQNSKNLGDFRRTEHPRKSKRNKNQRK